jgi:hypothetical protein
MQDLDADGHGRTLEIATVIAIGTSGTQGRLAAAGSTNLKVISTANITAGDTSSFRPAEAHEHPFRVPRCAFQQLREMCLISRASTRPEVTAFTNIGAA